MSTSSGDPDVLLARASALLAVMAVVVVALQGCGAGPRASGPTSATTEAPAAAPATAASAAPAPYRLPPFRPQDRGDWRTRIPADLRVDVHLPRDGGDYERGRLGVRADFCGEEAFTPGAEVDRRILSASGPEYGEARDLRLFADDRAAHRFVRAAHAVVVACPGEERQAATWVNEVRRSRLAADESFTVVRARYTYDDRPVLGGDFWEVARIGNAVLLTATGGEYDAATTLDPGIRRHAADVAGLVEAMCVFAAVRCGA